MRQGFALHQKGGVAEAAALYRRILEADPGYADASYMLGTIAESEGRAEEATALFRDAVAAKPEEPAFLFALGKQCYRARLFEEAVQRIGQGLAIQPADVDARNDYGSSLMELGRWDEALVVMQPLAAENAGLFAARYNLGNLYCKLGRLEEALAEYRAALAVQPDHLDCQCCLLFTLNYSDRLTAAELFEEHRAFGLRQAPAAPLPAPDARWPRRLRVGYLSPDFRDHVVARFFAPVLSLHDRERFEVHCYYTHRTQDDVTASLRALSEHWHDCAALPDEALAQRIRGDGIDILVDLAGHTSGHRIGVLARKPAPIQVNYLGYPNTTGLPTVDYRMTDAVVDPPGVADQLAVERLLRLPRVFLAYRPIARQLEPGPLPALRHGYVTFGCFNNFLKQSGSFLDVAARVLLAVPGSRLVLKDHALFTPSVAERVRRRFAAAGIAPERLRLLGWTKTFADHLGEYREIDIALDSFPYNGTTTTCESIWMGVPVVTLQGDRHAARVGASLLGSLGLQELIAQSTEGFVALCARLASDVEGLKTYRAGLRERMRASPLMDEESLTRAIEHAYQAMWIGRLK
jgi:predicted O-linked N-acetylglucosamine transferase (SPINDLY family)